MKTKYLLLALILISCHRYEKKVLKVEVTCNTEAKWHWYSNPGGNCNAPQTQTVYLKEGSTLDVTIETCLGQQGTVIAKTGGHTLYAKTTNIHRINLIVERK